MKGYRALAPASLALAFAFLVAQGRSCATDLSQNGAQNGVGGTVRVAEIVPHELELGQRVAILGSGFQSGKTARVTFRGTLHRPGERPVRGAEVVVPGTAVGVDRVEVAFDDAFQSLLCGAGDRATHTTFEGDIEVAFGPAAPGAAPTAGVLEHVTVDARPSAGAAGRERERAGERALAWLGMQARAEPSGAGMGLWIDRVDPGSRAESAGISAGDVVTSFDGVRVASVSDLVPPAGESIATIGFRPERGLVATREIRVDGFRRAPPADLIGAAVLVWTSLVVVWLFAVPVPPLVDALVQRMIARSRRRAGGPSSGPPATVGAIVDVVVCALLAALPFGQYAVAARLDVSLLFVAAATSLAAAAVVAARVPGTTAWRSAWHGVRAALRVTWQHVPAAVAVASVVAATGSLRVQEIEGAQGGWPWEWLAFRSPAALLALGLLVASLGIEPRGRPAAPRGLAGLVEDGVPDASEESRPWLDAARRAHRVLVAGLASALFLGGWLLPALPAMQQGAHPVLELAGAAWFLAKTRLLVTAMAWLGRVVPGWRGGGFWVTPLALAAFAGTAAWSRWSPAPAGQLLVSLALVVAAGLAGLALAHRVLRGAHSAAADSHLSPFL